MVRKEEITFDSRDQKTKIYAVKWLPEKENPICIVQIIHGMAEYINRYDEFATYLAERGCVVVGEDHLGHGKTATESGMPLGYFCKQDPATVAVRDVHRLKKITQEQYPGVPYIIIGHSMGSFILRNYMFRYGTGIDGAVIIGTGNQSKVQVKFAKGLSTFLGAIQGQTHKSEFINVLAFGNYVRKIPNRRTKMDWVCSNASVVDAYNADELCGFTFTLNGFRTLFTLIDRAGNKENLEKIPKKLPILMTSGENDPVGNYGVGVKRLYDTYLNLGFSKVQMKLYPKMHHELLNEDIKHDVYREIFSWITCVID